MKEKIQLELNKKSIQRLKEISTFLNIPLSKLVELAFQELFLLIRDETNIFLEEIGFYEQLIEQIT